MSRIVRRANELVTKGSVFVLDLRKSIDKSDFLAVCVSFYNSILMTSAYSAFSFVSLNSPLTLSTPHCKSAQIISSFQKYYVDNATTTTTTKTCLYDMWFHSTELLILFTARVSDFLTYGVYFRARSPSFSFYLPLSLSLAVFFSTFILFVSYFSLYIQSLALCYFIEHNPIIICCWME